MLLFVANWKMNLTRREAAEYVRDLSSRIGPARPAAELSIAPPFTAFDAARDPSERWSLTAQNVASEHSGPFTGEVSARMLAEAGCRFVIVGHSERRRLFGERPETLARKLARAREEGLIPIYCLGETAEERAAGETAATLARQVESLRQDPSSTPLVVAYEPVWAIGTGHAATPEDAAAARQHLLRLLGGRQNLRILYGGSVAPENAPALLEFSGMDGFLIGGASLNPAAFAAIAGVGRP
ncbi:MAG: triose-phosphate isomerase [Thermoanaerobaculia bacterium]